MNNINKVEVRISGKSFFLTGVESAEYITDLAKYVDKKITQMNEFGNNNFNYTNLKSLLLAINIADDLFKEKMKHSGIDKLEEENEQLKREVLQLRGKVSQLKYKLNKRNESV